MGTDYSAKVFFGAWVVASHPLADVLDGIIDEDGGTPAETSVDGVQIGIAGNTPSGDMFYTIEAEGSEQSYGKYDKIEDPVPLEEEPQWRPAIARFLAQHGATDLRIGWHFVGVVM